MGMFKNVQGFLIKKMLRSKLKDVPPETQDKMIAAIQTNPELFQKIAAEIEQQTKSGKDQMAAAMEVMQKYQSELQTALK